MRIVLLACTCALACTLAASAHAADDPRDVLGDPLDLDTAPPEDAPPEEPDDDKHHFLVFPMPLLGYNSDEGIGLGAVVSLHDRVGQADKLRNELALRLFGTTQLVQRHELRWEGNEVLGLPLRMWTRLGLYSTNTQLFCGRGNGVTCDEGIAKERAEDRGLREGTHAYDEFVRHYYLVRYVRPHADTLLRWRLKKMPHAIELFHGWRGARFFPGSMFERGPYAGSLYASEYPHGERGISSVLQVGLAIDNRDFEPAPSDGYFVEASVRAAHPWLGSAWTWAGFTTSASHYAQLLPSPHLVWANRALIDLIAGEPNTEDVATIGGIKSWSAFGGQWIGRGVREHRYLGKLKALHQTELRLDLFGFSIRSVRIDVGVVGFGDVGWVAWDWQDLAGARGSGGPDGWRAGDPLRLVWGAGTGVRFIINRAAVAQGLVAGSASEQRSPSFYTPVGNAW
jgi:hypothetical protein